MAKKFGDSPAAKRFGEVAGETMADTNIAAVRLIKNSALSDYPDNGEDTAYTADLENSIKELGFTDPIEITDFGMPEGQYIIISGHRRRAAGVKCGMELFPCIIKSFGNEDEVRNYVLLANSQRDSAKDPLLFCTRYKMHERHLKSIGFKGSAREEIAKRLGISVQQADRYNQMNKVIKPVWELVREDSVGMSSVLPMSALNEAEQYEILEIIKKALSTESEMTREKVKKIIEKYKSPHREEFSEAKSPHGEDFSGDSQDSEPSKAEAEAYLPEAKKILNEVIDKLYVIGKRYRLDEEVGLILKEFSEKIK